MGEGLGKNTCHLRQKEQVHALRLLQLVKINDSHLLVHSSGQCLDESQVKLASLKLKQFMAINC